MRRLILAALLLLAFAPAALAIQPDEILDDPVLEERARELSKGLRCVVCQNESIDTSNAEIARTMRLKVRERLVEGDSDAEVMDYMVSRYGDYVLMRPPVRPSTYALWFGPAVILLLGALGVALYLGRRRRQPAGVPPDLTPEERARVEALIEERRGS